MLPNQFHTQLRAFHAVANAGSFTAASRLLNVSQPTVTTQVGELERGYGIELFFRHGRGVKLSPTGQTLLGLTRRLFAQEQESFDYLSAVRELRSGDLKIAAVGPYHVTEMLAHFHRRFPEIKVCVSFGNSREVQEAVLSYASDIGVSGHLGDQFGAPDYPAELDAVPYSRPEMVVVVAKDHPWAGRRSIRIEELDGQPMINREPGSETRRAFERATREAGVAFTTALEVGGRDGLLAAAAAGLGIGMVSQEEYIPEATLCKLRVRNAALSHAIDVICLGERRSARLIGAFLEVVDELKGKNRPRLQT